ncbi:hypothetical protein IAT38_007806 [Cryptococcus sp. DSM 104549]
MATTPLPNNDGDDISLISSPLTLPNGVQVPNRLVKAAMAEGIGLGGGPPREGHINLYRKWGEGGWGIVVSGNVQVDPRQLASPQDLSITPTPHTLKAYTALASAVHSSPSPPLLLMQLSHPGLQSSSVMGARMPWEPAIAPCAARPDIHPSLLGSVVAHSVWPLKSRKVDDVEEWVEIARMFVGAAVLAENAGWDGVQVHSAHGYLLAEYLSAPTNPNPKHLPGVPEDIPLRLHLLYLILRGIADNTSQKFIKAVKVNCSDFVQGGLDEAESSEIIKTLVSWSLLDIIEISGGNYTSPVFAFSSSSARQSLFAYFTRSLLPSLPPPPAGPAILLTGGLHDRELIASSLRERACDLVGIGRPACLVPNLPSKVILNPDVPSGETNVGGYTIPGGELAKKLFGGTTSGSGVAGKTGGGIPLVGAGVSTFWHQWQLCRLGRGAETDEKMTWLMGLLVEGVWWEGLRGGPVGWWRYWTG